MARTGVAALVLLALAAGTAAQSLVFILGNPATTNNTSTATDKSSCELAGVLLAAARGSAGPRHG